MDSLTYLQHAPFFTFITGLIDSRHFAQYPIRVLEVGCGTGEFAHLLKHHYKDKIEVTGIEPMATQTNKPDITFIKQELLNWSTESLYDVVLFTKSLHHCNELEKTVKRAYDLLVPGGLLVVEEVQPEKMNSTTIAWLFDRVDLLTAAKYIPSDHPVTDSTRPAQERWEEMHHPYHPCHRSQVVRDTLLSVFGKTKIIEQVPLFHFHLPMLKLEDSPVGRAILAEFMAQEDRALAKHAITSFGYTVLAEKENAL